MKLLLLILLSFSAISFADPEQTRHFESGVYQTHLLELYTSEGCSSCPSAEAWLRNKDVAEFKRSSVIPLAFHVTYWDYIGWKDLFAAKQYDRRQRKMVLQEGGRTVYTPQFFIDSQTKRGMNSSIEWLANKGKRLSVVKIKASLKALEYSLKIKLNLKKLASNIDDVVRVGVVAYENGIKSTITAGENEGRVGHHQYVVRELQTSLISLNELKNREFEFNTRGKNWSGMVVFVESDNKVIEALDMPL
jgi:hypothetical protein